MKRSITSAVCIIIAFGLLVSVTLGLVILSSLVKELQSLVFLLLAFQVVAIILIVLFIFLLPVIKDDKTETH